MKELSTKVSMKKAGYKYVKFDKNHKLHILQDIDSGKYEAWCSNKNHASWGIVYKNTHLEFVSSFLAEEIMKKENN